jgi:hypothetical protein
LIDQIGLLTPHEVEKVMNAYLMIQQMAETIRLLPGTTLKGRVPKRGVGGRPAGRSDRHESGGGWPDDSHRGDFR